MDAFAGVSQETEQRTVRSSRRLSPDFERHSVGPITYDIVEPLRRTRYRLAANDIVPILFDVEIEGMASPAMEERRATSAGAGLGSTPTSCVSIRAAWPGGG